MNYYSFLRPVSGEHPLDDFEQQLAELAMKPDRDFGSFQHAAEMAFAMFEKARPNMALHEVPQFLKIVGYFKLLADFAAANEDTYLDFQAELTSYISGNFFTGENGEAIFADHKKFNQKYPHYGILPEQD